jgi:thymidylate kinase
MIRIVLTGGPCGGKTSALSRVKEYFEKKGKKVVCLTETASELLREGKIPCGKTAVSFHAELVKRQIAKEELASFCDIVVCDRGALDIRAYLSESEFAEVMEITGSTASELLLRYDAVFHLVTAANGAEKEYTLSNNNVRSEDAEQAKKLDEKSFAAWAEHKNHTVIDNSTDFNGKMARLISKIEEILKP